MAAAVAQVACLQKAMYPATPQQLFEPAKIAQFQVTACAAAG